MRRSSEAASTCRIERKRAHDREAQRASRAKTKAYITHLEKTVADLTEGSGDTRANYLAQHASQQTQEIDKLKTLVGKIRTLVNEAGDKFSQQETSSPGLKLEGNVSSAESAATNAARAEALSNNWEDSPSDDQDLWGPSEPTHTGPVDLDADDEQYAAPAPSTNPVNSSNIHQTPKTPAPQRSLTVLGISLHCAASDDNSYALRLNTLIQTLESSTPDNLSDYETDVDILVRALTQSWDEAERHHHFDIVWRFLRAFDEGLWISHAGIVERFASTWNMRSIMLHRIAPKNQERRRIASFMAPTIEQKNAPKHPPLIHYFAWPQVRNQLLVQGITYCSGDASMAFAQSFRFVWPWEIRDIYKVNRGTGLFSFSEAFLRSWNDLSCYRVLHNRLIPFWVHSGQQTIRGIDVSHSKPQDHAITPMEAVVAQTQQLVHTDATAEDWMSSFNLALSEESGMLGLGSYSHPFASSHTESNLMQWSTA